MTLPKEKRIRIAEGQKKGVSGGDGAEPRSLFRLSIPAASEIKKKTEGSLVGTWLDKR